MKPRPSQNDSREEWHKEITHVGQVVFVAKSEPTGHATRTAQRKTNTSWRVVIYRVDWPSFSWASSVYCCWREVNSWHYPPADFAYTIEALRSRGASAHMRFTPEDATARYRATLTQMQPAKVAHLGDNWDKAKLSFYFPGDQNLAAFSARDTLVPMLREDNRTITSAIMNQFLAGISLDQQAADVAGAVFDSYATSSSIG